jgi:segregation and condensation protein B
MERQEYKNIIEAILFVSTKPVRIRQFSDIIGISPEEVKILLEEMQQDYKNRGLQILQIAGGYQFATKPEYSEYIKKFIATPASKLSKSALETLAIIVYKQPITKPEIEKLRGVNVDGVINTLLEKKLIKISGRKNSPGRPFLFSTTEEFLTYFGINSLSELPKLSDAEDSF